MPVDAWRALCIHAVAGPGASLALLLLYLLPHLRVAAHGAGPAAAKACWATEPVQYTAICVANAVGLKGQLLARERAVAPRVPIRPARAAQPVSGNRGGHC